MKFISLQLDFLGFTASALCAIHCMAMPFILTFGMVSGNSWLTNEWLELGLIAFTLIVASVSLIRSYRHEHYNKQPLVVAAVGFALVIVSHLFFIGSTGHSVLAVGGFIIAYAHFKNWIFIREAKACASK